MTTLTARVRKILRETGMAEPNEMWTNRFDNTGSMRGNCRTVKCYLNANDSKIVEVMDKLAELAAEVGRPITSKVINNSHRWYVPNSFVVRVPLED